MKILVIEDDKSAAINIVRALEENNISSNTAYDGETGLNMAKHNSYDVLIIDRMLPNIDGISIVKELRKNNVMTPILILTALGEIDDTVDGLDAGADDYMTKPFVFIELLARVRSLAKRNSISDKKNKIIIGQLTINRINRTVERQGKTISLKPRELDLLIYLADKEGEPSTRKMLLKNVWGLDFNPQTNIVDVHISRLRNKVDKGFKSSMIKTVRGIGYVLSP